MDRPLHTIKRRSAAVVWLLAGLLLVLPTGQHAVAGIVLCLDDGGSHVEDGRYGDCGEADRFTEEAVHASHAPAVVSPSDASHDDCGDCLDVALLVNPAENRVASKTATAPVLFAPALLATPLLLPIGARDPILPAPPPPAPSLSLAALSTVVLLA